jgi:mono/diheme cytochrome c family protein
MKKLLKVLAILLLSVIVILLLIVAYIKIALPNVGPAPEFTIDKSAARIARGNYLAKSVMACMDCHSARSLTEFTMPLIPASLGEGGERFDQTMGFPGIYYAANITPAGIGNWTDGEIYRAITTGVRKNGKPIFPVMPYHSYGFADPEDVKSMIVYLRSLKPIEHKVPESSSDFPFSIILNTVPGKATPLTIPSETDSVGNGRYLMTIGACHDCHTPFEKGKFDETFSMAGGRVFPVPGGMATSANITPDKETGIGSWSKSFFIQRFANYRDSINAHRVISAGEFQTIMPWTLYGTMTDKDLGNIYAYIQTLKPIKHLVGKFRKTQLALGVGH